MKYYKSPINEIFAYEADGSQDRFIPADFIKIAELEAKEITKQKETERFLSLDYTQKRLLNYPSIGDQLDALFKAGVFPAEMSERIADVKTKYPKE